MQCLAADPRRPGALYADSRGEGVWRSVSDGNDWTRLGFPESDVYALTVSPADGVTRLSTFSVRHLGFNNVKGKFGDFEGALELGKLSAIPREGALLAAGLKSRW